MRFEKYKIKSDFGWLVGVMPDFYPSTLAHLRDMAEILGNDYGPQRDLLSFHHCGGQYNARKTVVQALVQHPLDDYATVSAEWRG